MYLEPSRADLTAELILRGALTAGLWAEKTHWATYLVCSMALMRLMGSMLVHLMAELILKAFQKADL